jgi:hypothetical protein
MDATVRAPRPMAIAGFAGKSSEAWKSSLAVWHKNVPHDENANNDVAAGSGASHIASGAGTR